MLSIIRKGQLIIKDTEKVKAVFTRRQNEKAEIEKNLGPIVRNKSRFKKLEL